MLITEYRIVMPMTVEEYKVAQLYAVAEASKLETGGGEGVEVIENRPYEENGEKGQYTHKIYHLSSKVPAIIRNLAPKGSLQVQEKAWNAYPYCRTILTNTYMKDNFMIKIETWHKPDLGDSKNVHGLEKPLEESQIQNINIADAISKKSKDYKKESDPCEFKSVKTDRAPLKPTWLEDLRADSSGPHMCAYKLVTIDFKWFGLQSPVEKTIQKMEGRLFTNFHRQLFCWIDEWIDLSMDDIRRMEDETQAELDEMRKKDEVKGMTE